MMQKKKLGKTPKMLQGPNSNKEELVKLHALKNWESHEMTTLNYKKMEKNSG
jgi:hypothetical protein